MGKGLRWKDKFFPTSKHLIKYSQIKLYTFLYRFPCFFFKLSFEIFHGSSRISLLPQINLITFLSALYAKFLMLTLNILFYFMSCILINIAIFECQFAKLKCISRISFCSLLATIHSHENILLIASLRQCVFFFSLFLFFKQNFVLHLFMQMILCYLCVL